MSRDLLLHFVEGPRGKGCTVVNSQRLRNSSERYWNGLGISPVIQYFPSPLCSVPQSLVQAVRTEQKRFWMGTPLEHCNGKQSTVNKSLDGRTYPG